MLAEEIASQLSSSAIGSVLSEMLNEAVEVPIHRPDGETFAPLEEIHSPLSVVAAQELASLSKEEGSRRFSLMFSPR